MMGFAMDGLPVILRVGRGGFSVDSGFRGKIRWFRNLWVLTDCFHFVFD